MRTNFDYFGFLCIHLFFRLEDVQNLFLEILYAIFLNSGRNEFS